MRKKQVISALKSAHMKHWILILALAGLVLPGMAQKNKDKKQKNTTTTTTTTTTMPPSPKPAPKWAPKDYGYKPSETHVHDLIHTKLDVSFDWKKCYLNGKATLTLKPWFYATDSLLLDAKGMDIKKVAVAKGGVQTDLAFKYDQKVIHIKLDRTYSRDEMFTVYIEYTAKPNELPSGGSSAITSDKGLYFINPDGSDKNKPMQIWTQGETEASSCWFPTIDTPNERTTQEINITVPRHLNTLSNGVLVKSEVLGEDLRVDTWRQDKPHPPYLFMMGIGDFLVARDKWRGKEVSYYLEHEYFPYSKLIFGNTPEMLEFFSNKLGVEYPWDKYAQIVVRDYVSGAMENTSATLHGEFVQKYPRELVDGSSDDIIAHELFHQWFGDLVTCESWSNLPLNESFATYGEYLWNEYKYGKDQADHHGYQDLQVYLAESNSKREPIIRFLVDDKEDMFDAHSYQKGGRILHMLRNYLGDEAFFAGLKYYLTKNAYTDVEIHELRIAMEEVSGQDLNWFFNQWFLSAGHPEIGVDYTWIEDSKKLKVHVVQKQNTDYQPLFILPTSVGAMVGMEFFTFPVEIRSKDTTLFIPLSQAPSFAVFDADKVLLADIKETKTQDEWVAQLKNGRNYVMKHDAIKKLSESIDKDMVVDAMLMSLKDSFWGIRQEVLSALQVYNGDRKEDVLSEALTLAEMDQKSSVRKAALNVIKSSEVMSLASTGGTLNTDQQEFLDKIKKTLNTCLNDSSYSVNASALNALYKLDKTAAVAKCKTMENSKSETVIGAISKIYFETNDPNALAFAKSKLGTMPAGLGKFGMITEVGNNVVKLSPDKQTEALQLLMDIATNDSTWWIRLGAIRALGNYGTRDEVKSFLKIRLEKEENETIKNLLSSYVNGK